MNSNLSSHIMLFFENMSGFLAYFLLLLILYNYFFLNNDSISITYKELYIVGFISVLLSLVSELPKNAQ